MLKRSRAEVLAELVLLPTTIWNPTPASAIPHPGEAPAADDSLGRPQECHRVDVGSGSVDQIDTPAASRAPGRWVAIAAVSAAFVLGAIVVEMLAGAGANSPVPAWSGLFPLSWPQAARVVWWCAVAAAAGAFRLALLRLGIRQHPLVVVLSVAPFLIFAGGIATGASWATWH